MVRDPVTKEVNKKKKYFFLSLTRMTAKYKRGLNIGSLSLKRFLLLSNFFW